VNTHLARFLSVLFHPLLMPTLLFGLLLFAAPGVMGVDAFAPRFRVNILLLITINTFLLPALLILLLYRTGYVRSLHMDNLSDRRLPYFLTAVLYTSTTMLFAFRPATLTALSPEIGIVLASITVSVTLVGLISLFWKISAHSVGISGMIGAVAGIATKFGQEQLLYPLIVLVFLAGMLASARLHLNAHTPSQVAAGFGLGLLVSLPTVYFLV